MSTLALCVFFLAIGSLDSCNGQEESSTACLKEGKLSETELKALPLADMKVKCYHACRLEKQGMIFKGKLSGIAKPCHDLQDDNKCELASKVIDCLKQALIQDLKNTKT